MSDLPGKGRPLYQQVRETPVAVDPERAGKDVDELITEAMAGGESRLAELLAHQSVRKLIIGTFENSPYLCGLIRRDPARLVRLLLGQPDECLNAALERLRLEMRTAAGMPDAMKALRNFKSEIALLCGLCDLAGAWPVMKVTEVLTRTADACLSEAVRFLFAQAAARGDWKPKNLEHPDEHSGYIVLAMGKHGAFELNYSSDIDLIIFYELDDARARLPEGKEPSQFFVRLTQALVKLMQEYTADGYVFRTDLRLRPDAGATQVALSTEAAMIYYEGFGQNWERAALIKARPVAGDLTRGQSFLDELAPFIWRRYLDFAAIADIHAMKRQIHAFRGLGKIAVAGHNLKLGRGGIREIEFFAQTQQLIAGGRQRGLRVRRTLEALERLVGLSWITEHAKNEMTEAYLFLRRLEHRLQMIADEQTHTLPDEGDDLERVAHFAGFENSTALADAMVPHLEVVQTNYAGLFEDTDELDAASGNLVFAGTDDDPNTIETLERLGYANPSRVIATVRGWHHGRYPAVRSERSRERLTDVQPALVEALAETADPDRAMASFDGFVSKLPTGVQLFSLLRANPYLLRLVAGIMGSAPRLAHILSRRRRLLDAVIDPQTFTMLPKADEIDAVVDAQLGPTQDLQEALDVARVVGSEQSFLIGVRILTGTINADHAGGAYAVLAERLVGALQARVEAELQAAHGSVPGGEAVVVAMGKLGGRELTAASDLDLIVVYNFDEDATQSDGPKPLAPSQYYARMTQRLIAAISAPTAEGSLYEVDMRLRPSGQQGPLATKLPSFIDYQMNDAWTWEYLALTRARVITGPNKLRNKVERAIRDALIQPREKEKIAADVREMRERIFKEKGTQNIWELKQVRGGLVDLEFTAQYLQLIHAHKTPDVLQQNTLAAFEAMARHGIITREKADRLIPTTRLVHNLTQILKLCVEDQFDPDTAAKGLLELLAWAGDAPTFPKLQEKLAQALRDSADAFDEIVS